MLRSLLGAKCKLIRSGLFASVLGLTLSARQEPATLESMHPFHCRGDPLATYQWILHVLFTLGQDILLVGEANRTLSLVLAAWRGSFAGIYASSEGTVKRKDLVECIHLRLQELLNPVTSIGHRELCWLLIETPLPWNDPARGRFFISNVDTCKLHGLRHLPTANIWLQCSWGSPRSGTGALIPNFLESAAKVQVPTILSFSGLLSQPTTTPVGVEGSMRSMNGKWSKQTLVTESLKRETS